MAGRDILRDGRDVTDWKDRRLLLLAVDEVFAMAGHVGRLATAQALAEKEIRDLKVRVTALEEVRAKSPSVADVEEIAGEAARRAVDESGAHHVPPDADPKDTESQRFRRWRERSRNEDDAEQYRAQKAFRTKVYGAAAATVVGAVVLAVLVAAWRIAVEHERGVVEGKAQGNSAPVFVPMPPAPALPPALPPASSAAPDAPASAAPRRR